ncbi:flagellar hook-associated protein FlgK [Desulfosporosinus nitroreducens]|uniref:Flagellar hook-associated protein 1 n=1 Tax=Desulfosporosinus nitroreducens TaxID=2018668 RepID=A0ABT8QKG6_9FIRM|nr:flagellar hook-associated protein FlgK [Desulfosporosinus nitroreducens]MDO0821828.1 flagellar hook-associated protein FlgK [Desulfosporosinus nitroreducens]
MGSTFGGLNILSRSLYANQASLETVGHNIANAGTDGYSRQRVNLATASPSGEVYGLNKNYSGSGVTVASIIRARDRFTDEQLWKESSSLSYSQTSSAALTKMEGVFTEPSETGIQTVLNRFWTSWQTLSTNASDSGARTAVAQQGVALVNAIKHAAEQLRDTAANINTEVVATVNKINQISESINKLNEQIYFTEFSGTNNANDLRDSRDLLVDELSKLVDVSVKEDSTGRYTIQTSGLTLVDAKGYCNKLSTETTAKNTPPDNLSYDVTKVVFVNNGNVMNFADGKGELKALLDSRDSSTKGIKGYMTSLENVSQFLLQDFNDVHRKGYGTNNESGRNFFGDGTDGGSPAKDKDYKTVGMPTGSSWIDELTVNSAITGSTAGLAIIAAKTTFSLVSAVTPDADNTGSATVTATGTGTYVPTDPMNPATPIDPATPTTVRVTVDDLGVIKYSASTNGVDWSTPITTISPITVNIQGMDVTIAVNSTANPTSPTEDTYEFTLSKGNNNASGDNAILLGNCLKTDTSSSTLGNVSLDSYYSAMIGTLGVQSQDAQRLGTNQKTVVDQLINLRASTSGVNMDEEMTDMIRFQKGYNASARVLTAMDEMLDKLINGTGIVGR